MDERRFDNLARQFATKRSRRSLLQGMIGGGAAVVAAKTGSSLAAPAAKVDVCHWDNDAGAYVWINISENAWIAGHQGKHDRDYLRGGGCCSDGECAAGETCNGGTCAPVVTTTTGAPEPCPPYTTRSESTGECAHPCDPNPCTSCPPDTSVRCVGTVDGGHICEMNSIPASPSGNCPVDGCSSQFAPFICYSFADGTYQCLHIEATC